MPFAAQALFLAAVGLQPSDVVGLQWDAPPECPGAADVQRAFERHAKPDRKPVDAVGHIKPVAEGYVLTLELRTDASEDIRVIRALSCDALADTAGLLIAVASEPAEASVAELVRPPEPGSSPAPEVERPPVRIPATEIERPLEPSSDLRVELLHERTLRFALRVDGHVQAFRLLPQIVGAGVSAAVGVLGIGWRAELRGTYIAPQERNYQDLVVDGAFDLWTAGAAGCWEPHWQRISLPLCGGIEAGSLRGRTERVEEPAGAGALFVGLTGDATIAFAPIPRLALRGGVGGVVAARRPRFHVRGRETLFQAGPGALRASFGIEVRFR